MSEEPPDSGVETFTVDFERLTAGPTVPKATRVKIKKAPAAREKRVETSTAAADNAIVLSPLAVDDSTVALPSPGAGSGSVNTLLQNMTTIHHALSSSGYVVIAKDAIENKNPPEAQWQEALGDQGQNVQGTPVRTPPKALAIASEMDVAAYQEATPEEPMEVQEHPISKNHGNQMPFLVGPFNAADLLPLASQGAIQAGQITPSGGPFPISLSCVTKPQGLKIIRAGNLLQTGTSGSRSLITASQVAAPGDTTSSTMYPASAPIMRCSQNMTIVPMASIVSASPSSFKTLTNGQGDIRVNSSAGKITGIMGTPVQMDNPAPSECLLTLRLPDNAPVDNTVDNPSAIDQPASSPPIPCSACEDSINNSADTKEEDLALYQCDACGQMRMTKKSDQTESNNVASEIPRSKHPFECPICWMNFSSNEALKAHQSVSHQAPSSFRCSFCTGIFSYQYECEMHEQFTHDKAATLTCKLCSKDFLSKKRLKKHAAKCWNRSGQGDIPMAGGGESKKTKADGSNKWYNIPVDATEEKARICKKCGRKFKNLRNYVRHIQNFCGVTSYKCEGCREEFPTKRKLSEHEKEHADDMHYPCPTCDRRFRSKQGFRTHFRLHEGQRPYKCKFCEKGFVALNKCLVHERSHTGERPYSCQVCGKEYVMKESLRVHERKHREDFRFYCKYCKKGFVKKYTHQVHERNHEGHKPFSCRYCSKAFSRKADCTRHELCTHSLGKEAYRFLCSHCGKAFKLKGDLKVHESIHTGEKSRYCNLCHRRFGRVSYYNRHMRLFHGEEPDANAVPKQMQKIVSSDREEQKKTDAAEALMKVAIGVINALPST